LSKWWWPWAKKPDYVLGEEVEATSDPFLGMSKTEQVKWWLNLVEEEDVNGEFVVPRGTFANIARDVGCRHSLVGAVAKQIGVRTVPRDYWEHMGEEDADALDAA
jgi:hypothetical protein